MRFMPHVRERAGRGLLFGCMALGAADDHRHVGLAQRLGAGRRRRHPAASLGRRAGLYPRPRPRAQQRAGRARPVARHPDGLGALRQFGRIRAHRLAHRHRRLRHRGAAADADVGAAHASRPAGHRLRRQRESAVRGRRQARRQDARAGVRPRPDQRLAATPSARRRWR